MTSRLPYFSRQSAYRWRRCQPYESTVHYTQHDPGTHFRLRLNRPQCHSAAGKLKSTEKKIQWHRESNPRPTGLWLTASTTLPRAPRGQLSIMTTLHLCQYFASYARRNVVQLACRVRCFIRIPLAILQEMILI
jgi:hypothetical protein